MDKKRSARTASVILSMMRDAISSGNEKDYWKTLGFVEGMKRAGSYDEAFAKKLGITSRPSGREGKRPGVRYSTGYGS